jgi:ATP-dependent DNA ligase
MTTAWRALTASATAVHDPSVFLYAFDLIELNGDDLRREMFETPKRTLASVLAKAAPGLQL